MFKAVGLVGMLGRVGLRTIAVRRDKDVQDGISYRRACVNAVINA